MRSESSFEIDGDLIIVETVVSGPRGQRGMRLLLDTGSALTTLVPMVAAALGYSPADRVVRSVVRSPVGEERGFIICVAEFTALGFTLPGLHVNVCDLGFDDIDGLLGMNFLNEFNYEIRSAERRILVENVVAPTLTTDTRPG
jgi:predicted aspartyl protease